MGGKTEICGHGDCRRQSMSLSDSFGTQLQREETVICAKFRFKTNCMGTAAESDGDTMGLIGNTEKSWSTIGNRSMEIGIWGEEYVILLQLKGK